MRTRMRIAKGDRKRAVQTSCFGSFWRSCCSSRTAILVASTGWTGKRVSSRSWTQLGLPNCGASVRTGPPWTTTSSPGHSGSTTRRERWRKLKRHRGWCTSSANRTTSKSFFFQPRVLCQKALSTSFYFFVYPPLSDLWETNVQKEREQPSINIYVSRWFEVIRTPVESNAYIFQTSKRFSMSFPYTYVYFI